MSFGRTTILRQLNAATLSRAPVGRAPSSVSDSGLEAPAVEIFMHLSGIGHWWSQFSFQTESQLSMNMSMLLAMYSLLATWTCRHQDAWPR